MLIYLDANIVQYCADYEDFIFGDDDAALTNDSKLLRELKALRTLVQFEQLGQGWEFAAPARLIRELRGGRPTPDQRSVCDTLLRAWQDSPSQDSTDANDERTSFIERSLCPLRLKDAADRWHLAESIALHASWFLTMTETSLTGRVESPN